MFVRVRVPESHQERGLQKNDFISLPPVAVHALVLQSGLAEVW
jgi:hypothetical protein